MSEKITAEWDFQKDGMPFDELPSVVKRNPGFLYEYVRTGKMPDVDLLEDLVKCNIKSAKRMIKSAKNDLSLYGNFSNKFATEEHYKAKEAYDEFFIESGYIYRLFTFEELAYDVDNFYPDDPSSLRRIYYELDCFEKTTGIEPPRDYALILWLKAVQQSAENKLKELEEYELIK